MAVMLETSRGDMVIDLFTEDCPLTTKNFLKLCKYVCDTVSRHAANSSHQRMLSIIF